ncbi:MAG: hypothetical protein ACYTGH_07165 [Planctomycetota bacterium]|jgi:hypothetical protein
MGEENGSLSEKSANLVENMAIRLAAHQGGTLLPNHLIPYLPISLGVIRTTLDAMVDGHAATTTEIDGLPGYAFSARPEEEGGEDQCVACRKDLGSHSDTPAFCSECWQSIADELKTQADASGWPAKAVYEHEVLYLAAQRPGPHYAAELAGRSRYTLKRMQEKLKALTLSHAITQAVDAGQADVAYTIPGLEYPRAAFDRNIALIQSFPAAMREEIEFRMTRIILTLVAMLLGVFALSFLRIPLPLLLVLFAVAAPIVSIHLWRHRKEMPE